jgi:hypothetical protein
VAVTVAAGVTECETVAVAETVTGAESVATLLHRAVGRSGGSVAVNAGLGPGSGDGDGIRGC